MGSGAICIGIAWVWQRSLERLAVDARDQHLGSDSTSGTQADRTDTRNGFYEEGGGGGVRGTLVALATDLSAGGAAPAAGCTELLAFFQCPRPLCGSCGRPMRSSAVSSRSPVGTGRARLVCFVKAQRVERIVYWIFNRFNWEWHQRTLREFRHAA